MVYINMLNHIKNLSIMGSVLIVILLIIRKKFEGDFSAKWSYSLWGFVLIRFFIPILPKPVSRYLTIYHFFFMSKYDFRATDLIFGSESNIISSYKVVNKSYSLTETISQSLDKTSDYFFVVFWALGISLMSLILFSSWMRIRKIVANSWEMPPLSRMFRVRIGDPNLFGSRIIRIRVSNQIRVPLTTGIRRPYIIFPEHLYNLTSEKEKYFILLHEYVHIKRNDVFFTYASIIICVFNWFNPLVWIAYILSKRDCELACDESVLEQLCQGDSKAYGLTIVKTLEYISVESSQSYPFLNKVLAKGMISSRKEIGNRINRVAEYRRKNRIVIVMSLVVLLGLSIFTLNDGSNEKRGLVYIYDELSSYLGESDVELIDRLGEHPYQKYNVQAKAAQSYVFSYDFIGSTVQFWFEVQCDSGTKVVEEITMNQYDSICQGMGNNALQEILSEKYMSEPEVVENDYFIKYQFVKVDRADRLYRVSFNLDKMTQRLYSISIEGII